MAQNETRCCVSGSIDLPTSGARLQDTFVNERYSSTLCKRCASRPDQ